MKSLFRKFNLFPKDHGHYKSHDIAVDGTKVKEVNSMSRTSPKHRLKKTMGDLDNKIDKCIKEMGEIDSIEESIDKEKIRKAIKKLKKKKEMKKA